MVFNVCSFNPQAVDRSLELAGGDEEAALMLLLDGAIDSVQQQQHQIQPLSVRFAKAPAPAALPLTRPRYHSSSPPRHDQAEAACASQASTTPAVARALCEPAGAETFSANGASSPAHAHAAGQDCPNHWVLLQHPDDSSVVAYGNVVTREFSLEAPCSGGDGIANCAGLDGC